MSKIKAGLIFQLVHNILCYNNSYIEKMAQRANNKIEFLIFKKIKTDIEPINDTIEEMVNAEAGKFSLLFKNTFSNHIFILFIISVVVMN